MKRPRTTPPAATSPPAELISAAEAAALLGVQRASLYAYVSRGLLTSAPGRGRASLYRRDEVERLRARSQARAGHEAVAAGALRWGDPVIATAIADITPQGPRYRGHLALDLVHRDLSYEAVAGLLWRGDLDPDTPPWSPRGALAELRRLRAGLPEDATPLAVIRLALAQSGAREGAIGLAEPAEEALAARLIARLAALAALPFGDDRVRAAASVDGVARITTLALLGRDDPAIRPVLEATLILCADHDLNASTFAARVVASTGADLHACLGGAAAALSGPLHGGASARVEGLLGEAAALRSPTLAVRARFARGEAIPGFGHPLYPAGDPRATHLLRLASAHAPGRAGLRRLLDIAAEVADAGHAAPNLDFGLVAVAEALALPRGSASALFAIGRAAGWVAHILEQRRQGFLLRPTARYIGPEAPKAPPPRP